MSAAEEQLEWESRVAALWVAPSFPRLRLPAERLNYPARTQLRQELPQSVGSLFA